MNTEVQKKGSIWHEKMKSRFALILKVMVDVLPKMWLEELQNDQSNRVLYNKHSQSCFFEGVCCFCCLQALYSNIQLLCALQKRKSFVPANELTIPYLIQQLDEVDAIDKTLFQPLKQRYQQMPPKCAKNMLKVCSFMHLCINPFIEPQRKINSISINDLILKIQIQFSKTNCILSHHSVN